MPESTSDASILIATSFQALNRAIQDNKETIVCDATVVILFAAFFIEANLNHIIDTLNKKEEMLDFLYGKKRPRHPGLEAKLRWFFNEFIETLPSDKKLRAEKLEISFVGFSKIHTFRNDVSHGTINLSIAKDAEEIRQQAKNIVNKLYDIVTTKTGAPIPRDKTYMDAISSA